MEAPEAVALLRSDPDIERLLGGEGVSFVEGGFAGPEGWKVRGKYRRGSLLRTQLHQDRQPKEREGGVALTFVLDALEPFSSGREVIYRVVNEEKHPERWRMGAASARSLCS